MINFLAILLIAIAGANAACNDGGRVECYVDLYRNIEIYNKESLCSQLPLTQRCVNNTGCPMDQLDVYLESLIKSCNTSCDLYQSMECSKEFKRPKENMTFCQALKEIQACYTSNKCSNVMAENPAFFKMCDEAETKKDARTSFKQGRLGKIIGDVKTLLKNKMAATTTAQPAGSSETVTAATTEQPTGSSVASK